MGNPVSLLGSVSDHGGTIISGAIDVLANATPVARLGDLHVCPIPHHGVTPIIGNTTIDVMSDAANNAVIGSTTGCGATIISGAIDVLAG